MTKLVKIYDTKKKGEPPIFWQAVNDDVAKALETIITNTEW